MQRNDNSIMIFEIIRGGGETDWVGERMGQPTFSPGKKLTGGNSGLSNDA